MLTGRNVKAAPTYFGAKPPPEFETAFTSEVAGGDALIFVFYRNASGLFAAVEGGPKVMAAVPAALKGKRVRHCDPNRNVAPGTKPPVEIGPSDLLRDAKFKRPYMQALGPLAKEPWLMELDGPAQPVRKVQVAGNDYQLASVCKNHDCYDNNMVLLYAAASQTVYAKVVQRGHAVLVGAPTPPVVAEKPRTPVEDHVPQWQVIRARRLDCFRNRLKPRTRFDPPLPDEIVVRRLEGVKRVDNHIVVEFLNQDWTI